MIVPILVVLLSIELVVSTGKKHESWILNFPQSFKQKDFNNSDIAVNFESVVDKEYSKISKGMVGIDGEGIDAVEHFFWGVQNGIAMEIGALDGSEATLSQTRLFERDLNWRRVLVEGSPIHRKNLKEKNPNSFSVDAPICETEREVHYMTREFVGGIVEFMDEPFVKVFHPKILDYLSSKSLKFEALQAFTSQEWKDMIAVTYNTTMVTIMCVPLSTVLRRAHVHKVNFFMLDVEGGEFQILESINFKWVKFDVLSGETTSRSPGFRQKIVDYLTARDYVFVARVQRNSWFIHKDFKPKRRPGRLEHDYRACKHVFSMINGTCAITKTPSG